MDLARRGILIILSSPSGAGKSTLSRRVLEDDDTLPDVLNAAWLCRIQHGDEDSYLVRRIGDKAVDLCREIIRRRS